MTDKTRALVIGSRGSKLALWQAHHVRDRLLALGVPEVTVTIIKTSGDVIQDRSLSEVGGKGLFVKEIEEALAAGRIDLAVHSMKDMTSDLPDGLVIAAVPEREDPRDAWVMPAGHPGGDFEVLVRAIPEGASVGTSSMRRAAQLFHKRPDVKIVPLRGNVDTRLRKLDEGVEGLAAIVLACAGLVRLGLGARISAAIPIEAMLPAVGQGALALETREDDLATRAIVEALEHGPTRTATITNTPTQTGTATHTPNSSPVFLPCSSLRGFPVELDRIITRPGPDE